MLEALRVAVESHTGSFHCHQIHNEAERRVVAFRHLGVPAVGEFSASDVPGLREFYSTFGYLTLYFDEISGDAAYSIVSPAEWLDLGQDFADTFAHLSEDDLKDWLPAWCADCIVVGQVPASGNYLLVPASGPDAGQVFRFDHDGFEFASVGSDLPNFVERALKPDPQALLTMATHLRFSSLRPDEPQWWIDEMRDNRGAVVRTASE